MTLLKKFLFSRDSKKRLAARHGPSVWLLEGPTPILNISKTEIASWLKLTFYKVKLYKRKCSIYVSAHSVKLNEQKKLIVAIKFRRQPVQFDKKNQNVVAETLHK
jgi:hypothetical protein